MPFLGALSDKGLEIDLEAILQWLEPPKGSQ